MKRFILHTLTILVIAAIILLAFTWCIASEYRRVNFALPDTVTIIAIGPSTTGCALSDQCYPGFRNISKHGVELHHIAPLLPALLDNNPQIDTVLINFGRFPVFCSYYSKENPRTEPLNIIKYKLPFYYYNAANTDWASYALNPDFYFALLNPGIRYLPSALRAHDLRGCGFGDMMVDSHGLHKDDGAWSITWYENKTAEHGGNTYSRQWIQDNCAPIDRAARAAIDICRARDVTPILFFTPLYQYDRWVAPAPFREYMATFPPDILIADYEDFTFPDDTYYGDVHHLNLHGAHYFTTHLARHGIRTIPLSQWLTAPSPTN